VERSGSLRLKLKENFLVFKPGNTPSLVEGVFIEKICRVSPSSKISLKHIKDTYHQLRAMDTLIIIIPLLGDNDLIPELKEDLINFLRLKKPKGNKIFLIFKGDRHQSDEYVSKTSPAYLKTIKLFDKFPQTVVINDKLDLFTADKIADDLTEYCIKMSPKTISILNQMRHILGTSAIFDARKNHLDFYQPSTGNSLIKGLHSNDFGKIFQLIHTLRPRILNISYAYSSQQQVQYFKILDSVKILLAGSNNLTIHCIVQHFPNVSWLNLSANKLSSGIDNLNNLEHLQALQLYKNSLTEFNLSRKNIEKIKRLSLYRNQIQEIDFTGNHLQIQHLNLGANPLHILPIKLSKANNLEFLGLARTKIKELPDWLFLLPSLQTIDLSFIEENIPKAHIEKLRQNNIKIITRPGYNHERC